jgi:hypothetical protein
VELSRRLESNSRVDGRLGSRADGHGFSGSVDTRIPDVRTDHEQQTFVVLPSLEWAELAGGVDAAWPCIAVMAVHRGRHPADQEGRRRRRSSRRQLVMLRIDPAPRSQLGIVAVHPGKSSTGTSRTQHGDRPGSQTRLRVLEMRTNRVPKAATPSELLRVLSLRFADVFAPLSNATVTAGASTPVAPPGVQLLPVQRSSCKEWLTTGGSRGVL